MKRSINKKVLITVLTLLVSSLILFGLTSCFFESSYSSSSMKSGLEKAGYTVDVNPVIANLDVSKLDGYKSSLYAYKTINEREDGILILIFDSSANADKAGSSSNGVATEFMTQMHNWGRNHAPESDTSVYGLANNIVWAGSSAAKNAAGIK